MTCFLANGRHIKPLSELVEQKKVWFCHSDDFLKVDPCMEEDNT